MKSYGSDVLSILDDLTDAYVEVFTTPPWDGPDPDETRAAFRDRLTRDVLRPGFTALVEHADDGSVDGFITGWITPSPFRTDRAYGKVASRLGPEQVDQLLVGAFEIDELGVRRQARGTGLGRRLLEGLTAQHPRSWLLTWDQAHDTVAFYRRVGWREPTPVRGHENDILVFLAPTD
ncbi:GNAT family N-acetyltransferase [Kribbella yunnanensis]|uniref:GNAT family N-acetyltransferase n=1 Tax=Kribbella yunnanensis TaxID=190194 RepID=A0ABN2JBA2_9ACTN